MIMRKMFGEVGYDAAETVRGSAMAGDAVLGALKPSAPKWIVEAVPTPLRSACPYPSVTLTSAEFAAMSPGTETLSINPMGSSQFLSYSSVTVKLVILPSPTTISIVPVSTMTGLI